jgi:hypothetical protein
VSGGGAELRPWNTLMNITGVSFCALLVLNVALIAALGRFLTMLDRDDPKTFAEVATPEEIHLGRSGFYFLGPLKFLLFHIIPKSYELWKLSERTRIYVERLRWASILVVIANIAIPYYTLFAVT